MTTENRPMGRQCSSNVKHPVVMAKGNNRSFWEFLWENRKSVAIGFILMMFAGSVGYGWGRSVGINLNHENMPNETVGCINKSQDYVNSKDAPSSARSSITSPNTVAYGPNVGHSYDLRCPPISMPSAHLYLNFRFLNNQSTVLPWTEGEPGSPSTGHKSEGIVYRQRYGGLEVTQSGIYHVYAQLTYKPLANTHTRLVQCIFRHTPKDETEQPEPTVCKQQTKMVMPDGEGEVIQSLSLTAAIKVDIGDILFVNSSDISSVYHSYKDNYFGLYGVSQG